MQLSILWDQLIHYLIIGLFLQTKRLANIEQCYERRMELLNLFNITPSMRGLLIEGIQLLIFTTVCDLYKGYVLNEGVPIFTWLLFARACSDNPRTFFNNYVLSTKFNFIPEQVNRLEYLIIYVRLIYIFY